MYLDLTKKRLNFYVQPLFCGVPKMLVDMTLGKSNIQRIDIQKNFRQPLPGSTEFI